MPELRVVFIGLSVTSSWGNGHATNYRGLMSALESLGHHVTFLERDVPWYAEHRDLPSPPWGDTFLYSSVDELRNRFARLIRSADAVIVGSYVPEGVAVGELVCDLASGTTAFYDIDTPVTLAKLEQGDFEYLTPAMAARYDVYLSFTGGPLLDRMRSAYGIRRPEAFYCMVDPAVHYGEERRPKWDLGYLGTYSDDRQPSVEKLLLDVARSRPDASFAVAGPQYPESIRWPPNVTYMQHLPPSEHRAFYNSQRFTLNVTRAEMVAAGYSPSVRLFEAAACGVPVISDEWNGLDSFFALGTEILVARSTADVLRLLAEVSPDEARSVGERARRRVLAEHTAERRAAQLIDIVTDVPRDAERV